MDGLTALFAPTAADNAVPGSTALSSMPAPSRPPVNVLPMRGPPADSKAKAAVPDQGIPLKPQQETRGRFLLESPTANTTAEVIHSAINFLRDQIEKPGSDSNDSPRSRITLILDSPDVLVAAGLTDFQTLLSTISGFSQAVHASIISVIADPPLIAAASSSMQQAEDGEHAGPTVQFSELEQQNAGLITSLAHRATWVMQLHKLETGWAKDVSGVLAVSRGGSGEEVEETEEHAEEKELLYYVKGDGVVNVFERGSSGG